METTPLKDKELLAPKYKWPLIIVIFLAVLILAVVLILQSSDNPTGGNDQPKPSPVAEDIDQNNLTFARVGLAPLTDCDAVLNYYKEHALEVVTPWGLDGGVHFFGPAISVTEEIRADAVETSSSDGSQSSGGQSSYSTTNIQVEGVDEADIVKTDGDYIYVLNNRELRIIDIRQQGEGNPPTVIAEIDTGFYATDMLLSLKPEGEDNLRDTLIIIGQEGWQQLQLLQVDIDDRASPEVIANFAMDGNYIGMRLSDGVVRLVATSQPLGFDWETPAGSGLRAEEKALEANKEIIRNSELDNWVPAYRDSLQGDSSTNSLIACSQMLAPHVFSGLNTLSIITFNASQPLGAEDWQAIGLATDGQGIYATAEHVYVATAEVVDQETEDASSIEPSPVPTADLKTIIHKFGLQEDESTTATTTPTVRPIYLASGEVAGTLLNQFSMDEYRGDLRVAVTIRNWRENRQENHVKILRPEQGILEEIGTIAGLGIDESIYAVRFMGPQAYIVTFRRIDPLYALDLSDPTNPKALGELKITGFSSYLHPVGENLLLGVGQEASLEGFVEGLQISLFDTSDPTEPKRISQLLLSNVLGLSDSDNIEDAGGNSPAERDHRAFLFYENSSFIPYENYWFSDSPRSWNNEAGILIVKVDNGTLSVDKILKASREKDNSPTGQEIYLVPTRTIVVDDLVYGITRNGEVVVWQISTGELLYLITD